MTEIIPVEVQKKADVTDLVKSYESFAITNAEQYQSSGADLKKIKGKIKELDELRKSMTRPIDESKSKIMNFFKKPIGFLEEIEARIKSAMIGYKAIRKNLPEIEGVYFKSKYKAKIIDEKLIPKEYWIVDKKRLEDVATATKGQVTIPGVEFYKEEIVAAKGEK